MVDALRALDDVQDRAAACCTNRPLPRETEVVAVECRGTSPHLVPGRVPSGHARDRLKKSTAVDVAVAPRSVDARPVGRACAPV
jgi:hypothetical protein